MAVAVGKFSVYRAVLDEVRLATVPLYLAVPQSAYHGILSERCAEKRYSSHSAQSCLISVSTTYCTASESGAPTRMCLG
ncbi:MAG: hypothetical protein HXY40_07335 [Chloroflexi bacterium]|nr:hypothetical protein [Chloroflexota bacterium]